MLAAVLAAGGRELAPELERRLDADGSLPVLRDHRDAARPGAGAHGARGRRTRREVLNALSADAIGAIDALRSEIYDAGGLRVPGRFAEAARRGALREDGAAAQQEDQDRVLDRRLRARDAAPIHPIAAQDRRVPRAHQAQEHLSRCAAAHARRGRQASHVVQPDGRRDRTAVEQQPQPSEHPGAHRVRAPDPGGVRPGGAGRRHGLGGLQPDRAAHSRAPLRGRRSHRGVHERHGLPPGHCCARLRCRTGAGRAGHASPGEGGQLRHRLRPVGARARRHAQDHARRSADDDRPLLRGLPARACLPRRDRRRGAPRPASRRRCTAASGASPS